MANRCPIRCIRHCGCDGSVALIRDCWPGVSVLDNGEDLGFACAVNRGIGFSTGRYVGLLNTDTEVWPGAFVTAIGLLEARPHAAVVGCRLLNPHMTLQ